MTEPESLDPAWDYEAACAEIIQNVYQPLIIYSRDKIDAFVGVLPTDWKTSADGKPLDARRATEGTRHRGRATTPPSNLFISKVS